MTMSADKKQRWQPRAVAAFLATSMVGSLVVACQADQRDVCSCDAPTVQVRVPVDLRGDISSISGHGGACGKSAKAEPDGGYALPIVNTGMCTVVASFNDSSGSCSKTVTVSS